MGWVDELQGSKVGLDTAPLIYFTEENPSYIHIMLPFFEAMRRNEFTVITSTTTLLEALVGPIKRRDTKLAKMYRDILLDTHGMTTVLLDQDIAEEAARLRAFYTIRTPDAIQMATAIKSEASFFLTNDLRLPSLPNLKVLTLDELRTRPEYVQSENSESENLQ